jgi:hypothetical protein
MAQTSTVAAVLIHRERMGEPQCGCHSLVLSGIRHQTVVGEATNENRCALKLCLIPMLPGIRPRDGDGTAIAGHDPASGALGEGKSQ